MIVLSIVAALALAVDVHPQQITPGTPLRVDVHGASPQATITGSFLDQPLHFLRRPGTTGWIAFAGVDLDTQPGAARLAVQAREPDGSLMEKALDLTIAPKEFPTERLTVAQDYVEPPPEVMQRIARETATLRALWKEVTPEMLFDGSVERPLKGVRGRNFGRRRIFNGQPRSPHSGLDLSAPAGTPVAAAAAGRVVVAENHYFSGNLVVLDHGGGVYTVYAHLSHIDVKPGDHVTAGRQVGRVGATGRVTGAHLHFGAHVGRARVDPLILLDLLSPP